MSVNRGNHYSRNAGINGALSVVSLPPAGKSEYSTRGLPGKSWHHEALPDDPRHPPVARVIAIYTLAW